MLNLAATPWWVLPGVIIAILSLGIAIGSFKAGSASYQSVNAEISKVREGLEAKMAACKTEQVARLDALTTERRDIWEKVRATEKSVAVIVEGMDWMKAALMEIRERIAK